MKRKVSRREIPLAVDAVRQLESVLLKASRRRKLTTEHRQKLLKCAVYLKKRRKAAGEKRILLPAKLWLTALRCLSWVVENIGTLDSFCRSNRGR